MDMSAYTGKLAKSRNGGNIIEKHNSMVVCERSSTAQMPIDIQIR
jgi:hypothetical protein